MFEHHYYLVIVDQHKSFIKKAKSPAAAVAWHSGNDEGVWHIRKGIADFHYVGYQFLTGGTIKGQAVDIVDLGPSESFDTPLLRHRMPKGMKPRTGVALEMMLA